MRKLESKPGIWRSDDKNVELEFLPEYSKGILTFKDSDQKFILLTGVNAGFKLYRYDESKITSEIEEIPGINPTRSLVGGNFEFDGENKLSMVFYYHEDDYDDAFFADFSRISLSKADS